MTQDTTHVGDQSGWSGVAAGNLSLRVQPTSTTPQGTPPRDLEASTSSTKAGTEDSRPSKRPRLNKHESDDDPQVSWTDEQKTKFLTLILEQRSLGPLTKTNGNLQSQAIAEKMNKIFGTEFRLKALKNLLHQLRQSYFDIKFLRKRSGFHWDEETGTISANDATWEKLLKEYPHKKYSQLRDKPIRWYSLAEQTFCAASETEKHPGVENSKPKEISTDDKADEDGRSITPSSRGPSVTKKTQLQSEETPSKEEDTNLRVLPGTTAVPDASKTHTIAPDQSDVETSNPTIKAVTSMAHILLDQVSPSEYAKFVEVVESETNAQIFLTLVSTTNPDTCKAWLTRKSAKL
ncbi:hypothetical protein PGTUg99_026211 [Puccinia graminis f. sp. tritici]|uniref:Myb/SANT-like domain-containing protein n=1 Tax=Puccinia graminis f. sp. tritici TaxID=56615 RepID=A0A5B0PF53_PUCGR|nr:hypothetical protein PGTUg99_026211 [Puccinia graminis f. sp. tritici]